MSHLMLAYLAYLLAVASPGPSTLAISAAAMGAGRAAAVSLAAGVVCGSLIWAGLTALGLGALLMMLAQAVWLLKLLSGAYLLYLAWKSLRAACRPQVAPRIISRQGAFLRGLLLHLTNPKAILGWAAIFALGLPAGAGAVQMIALFGGCALIGICVNFGYALGFSRTPVQRAYRRARRWIEGAMAFLFALAGLRLLLSRGG